MGVRSGQAPGEQLDQPVITAPVVDLGVVLPGLASLGRPVGIGGDHPGADQPAEPGRCADPPVLGVSDQLGLDALPHPERDVLGHRVEQVDDRLGLLDGQQPALERLDGPGQLAQQQGRPEQLTGPVVRAPEGQRQVGLDGQAHPAPRARPVEHQHRPQLLGVQRRPTDLQHRQPALDGRQRTDVQPTERALLTDCHDTTLEPASDNSGSRKQQPASNFGRSRAIDVARGQAPAYLVARMDTCGRPPLERQHLHAPRRGTGPHSG